VVYDRVKQVNEEIQKLAGVFVGAKVLSVGHFGSHIPKGTKSFTLMSPFISFNTFDNQDALLSWLENGERNFLVIVNKDFTHVFQYSLTLEKGAVVQRVLESGILEPVGGSVISSDIDPGDADIFTWEKAKPGR
jgi:hypothetical protein